MEFPSLVRCGSLFVVAHPECGNQQHPYTRTQSHARQKKNILAYTTVPTDKMSIRARLAIGYATHVAPSAKYVHSRPIRVAVV